MISNRGHQPFSRCHHLVDTLVLFDLPLVLRTQLRARGNAPRNGALARQWGNHGNNKLSRHLVGILMSHWRPLHNIRLYKLCTIWRSLFEIVREILYREGVQ